MVPAGPIRKRSTLVSFTREDKVLILANLIMLTLAFFSIQNNLSAHAETLPKTHQSSQPLRSNQVTHSLSKPTLTLTPTPTKIPLLPSIQPSITLTPQTTTTPFNSSTSLPINSEVREPTSTPSPTSSPAQTVTIQSTPSDTEDQQILQALNTYRQKKGVASLTWDSTLGNFAQSRANTFTTQGSLDNHAGFQSMINNNGFAQMGFNSLGENSSWGDFSSATQLIEVIYAADAPHDQNQLNPQWSSVGIGVNGKATDLVFGGGKR